jgi:hypothetical protein
MVTSDRPEWHKNLPFGLPDDFDFACIRTEHDAMLLMAALPNRDRGEAALGLLKALGAPLEKHVVYSGLLRAWDHDHREVLSAFGDPQAFANALRKVAQPSGRNKPVRAWRGVSSPHAAYGISWTTDRDVACWFAMRFRDHRRSPLVFVADIPPALIIAEHDERAEREILVDFGKLHWECVVLATAVLRGSRSSLTSTTAISSRRSTLSTIGSSPLSGTRTRRMQKEQFNHPGYRQVPGSWARKSAPSRRGMPPDRPGATPTRRKSNCVRSGWKPSADRRSRRRPSASALMAGWAGWRSSATAARRGRACRLTRSADRATRRSGS